MKILQVAPYFIPYMGGQEKYVYNLSRHLVNNGHEVHVLTTNYPKSLKFEEIDGITVERQNVYLRPLRNPIAPGFIRFSKKIDEFDIVHMHNEYSFPVMLTALNKNKSTKYVLTNHIGKLIFENPFKDFFSELYIKSMGKLIYNRSDAIIVLSPQHKDLIRKIAPEIHDKIKIIPNAVDIEILEKLDNDISKEKQDIFTILYVGQLIKRKGLKWLLMAIKLLKKENRKLKLIMVGDGEDENYFKKLVLDYAITDLVEFKGKIDKPEILTALYKSSDVFVLPSLSEGLPTVILEALYYQLPVIATDIPGISEYFKDYTFLVTPKDEKKLAEILLKLSDEEELIKTRKKTYMGKKLVETSYSWKSIAKEYEKLYKMI